MCAEIYMFVYIYACIQGIFCSTLSVHSSLLLHMTGTANLASTVCCQFSKLKLRDFLIHLLCFLNGCVLYTYSKYTCTSTTLKSKIVVRIFIDSHMCIHAYAYIYIYIDICVYICMHARNINTVIHIRHIQVHPWSLTCKCKFTQMILKTKKSALPKKKMNHIHVTFMQVHTRHSDEGSQKHAQRKLNPSKFATRIHIPVYKEHLNNYT